MWKASDPAALCVFSNLITPPRSESRCRNSVSVCAEIFIMTIITWELMYRAASVRVVFRPCGECVLGLSECERATNRWRSVVFLASSWWRSSFVGFQPAHSPCLTDHGLLAPPAAWRRTLNDRRPTSNDLALRRDLRTERRSQLQGNRCSCV